MGFMYTYLSIVWDIDVETRSDTDSMPQVLSYCTLHVLLHSVGFQRALYTKCIICRSLSRVSIRTILSHHITDCVVYKRTRIRLQQS